MGLLSESLVFYLQSSKSRIIIVIYFRDSIGKYFSGDPLEGNTRDRKVHEGKRNAIMVIFSFSNIHQAIYPTTQKWHWSSQIIKNAFHLLLLHFQIFYNLLFLIKIMFLMGERRQGNRSNTCSSLPSPTILKVLQFLPCISSMYSISTKISFLQHNQKKYTLFYLQKAFYETACT